MRKRNSLSVKKAATIKLAGLISNNQGQPTPIAAPKPSNAPPVSQKPLLPTPPTPNPAAKLTPGAKPSASLTHMQKRIQPEVHGLKPEVEQPQEKSKGVLGGIQNFLGGTDVSKLAPYMGMATPLFEGVGGAAGIPGIAGMVDLLRGGKNISVLGRGLGDKVNNMFSSNQATTPPTK